MVALTDAPGEPKLSRNKPILEELETEPPPVVAIGTENCTRMAALVGKDWLPGWGVLEVTNGGVVLVPLFAPVVKETVC